MKNIFSLFLFFSVFACSPVHAQTAPLVEYRPVDPEQWDDGEVGFIYFFNRITQARFETISIETDVGVIVMEVDSTPNHDCPDGCPDTLTIIEWPSGYSVHPVSITVNEDEMGFITLFENSLS